MPKELEALLAQTDTLTKKAQGAVLSATLDIRKEITYLASKLNIAGSADAREAVFNEISKKLGKLGQRLNKLFAANDSSAAQHGAKQASADTGVKVKMSKAHTDAIVDTLKQTGSGNLAATMTQAMDKNIVTALRDATVSAFREQAVSGMTMRELEKVLRQKWEAVADDPKNLQFVDKSGRVWDTDTYINMQTRTNAARIYNDSLVESIGKATGSDLVMVSRGGDPDCKLCFPWEGRILSITGKTKGFPTYEEARAAGLFHPNCVHTLEPVDEELDADEIRLQSKFKPPAGLKPAEMDEQRYEIDIQRKIQEVGMSATEAKVAVDRDNLTTAIRMGLINEDAQKIVNGLTDEQVNALCPNGNPPTFAPVKDSPNKTEEWNKGASGGKLYVSAKNLTTDKLVEVADIGDGKPLEQIKAPVAFIGNQDAIQRANALCDKVTKAAGDALTECVAMMSVISKAKAKTVTDSQGYGISETAANDAYSSLLETLDALRMKIADDKHAAEAYAGDIAKLIADVPDSVEKQEETDNAAQGIISGLADVEKLVDKHTSELAKVNTADEIENANAAIAELAKRNMADKGKAILDEIIAQRRAVRKFAETRKQDWNKVRALIAAGAKWGAKSNLAKAANKQLTQVEGRAENVATNAKVDFEQSAYTSLLAEQSAMEQIVAEHTLLAQQWPAVVADAIAELSASAKCDADEAVKMQKRNAEPLKPELPKYQFPDELTADMIRGGNYAGGSTGAKVIELEGRKYVMKRGHNTSNEHLDNELLGNAAYRAAGIRAPDFKRYEIDGETVSLTQFIPNGKTLGEFMATATPVEKQKVLDQLREGFALDALMGNWDVLGQDQDNVLIDEQGKVWRIDNGSAFGFCAQGAKKNAQFWDKRDTIDDIWTMREAAINNGVFDGLSTGKVFRDAKRIDFDAVMKALPQEYQKRLEKPLAEMRSLIKDTDDLDNGGHIDEHTSGVLDDIHGLRKAGFQDRLAEINAQFQNANGNGAEVSQENIPSLLRHSSIINNSADASKMMRDFINSQDGSSGFAFIRSACSAQGRCSWEGDACKLKILSYQARGLEWDCTKVAVTTNGNGGKVSPDGALYGVHDYSSKSYEACVNQYKADPELMKRDAKAFRAMKAVTQTLFRDLPMAGKDGDDYLAVRIETDTDIVENAADNNAFGMIDSGSCESTATFISTYPPYGQITVRRVPLSRLMASFVMTDDSGRTIFAGDRESETTADLNGIPMWNGGLKKSTIRDLTALRKRYLKAEKEWIAAGKPLGK